MTRRLVVALTLAFALGAAGAPIAGRVVAQPADAGGAEFRGNPARTGEFPGAAPAEDLTGCWRVALPGPVAVAVVAGSVYASVSSMPDDASRIPGAIREGYVVALDATTGAERWRYSTASTGPEPLQLDLSAPAVAGGTVYVAGVRRSSPPFPTQPFRALVALDAATGAERWSFDDLVGDAPSPAVVAGTVYAVDGRATYALDAATGLVGWRTAHREDGTGIEPVGAPAVAGGVVYVPISGNDGRLVALDAATGAARWSYAAGGQVGVPTVAEGTVFLSVLGTGVVALDAGSGGERWRFAPAETAFAPYLTAVDGAVYARAERFEGAGRLFVVALDAGDGAERWRLEPGGERRELHGAAGVVAVGGSLVAPTPTGIVEFDAEGRERRRIALGGAIVPGAVAGTPVQAAESERIVEASEPYGIVPGDGALYAVTRVEWADGADDGRRRGDVLHALAAPR